MHDIYLMLGGSLLIGEYINIFKFDSNFDIETLLYNVFINKY